MTTALAFDLPPAAQMGQGARQSLRIVSLGAGVQSTTLALMVKEGVIQADAAIFSDTGWEPAAVYRHLDWLESVMTIPVHRVSNGNIRVDAQDSAHRFASMPLFVRDPKSGKVSMLRRQCTNEYKLRPIKRKAQELGATRKRPATMLIGFSRDEVTRMADSSVLYLENEYPLIDMEMTRAGCVSWMKERGYPSPVKSACVGCPLHSDRVWREMLGTPEWDDAVDFDRSIRTMPRIRGECFLHRSAQPLDTVDFRTLEDHGQTNWLSEDPGCAPFGCQRSAA